MKRLKQIKNKKQTSWFVLHPCCEKVVGYIHQNGKGQYVGVYPEKMKYRTFNSYDKISDWLTKIVGECRDCSDCREFKQKKFKIQLIKGKRRNMVSVSGEVSGNLGIHKENEQCYNVVHIKNGFKIRSFDHNYRARKFIELLHETGLAKTFDEWVAGDCKTFFGVENSSNITKLGSACAFNKKDIVENLNGADVLAKEGGK